MNDHGIGDGTAPSLAHGLLAVEPAAVHADPDWPHREITTQLALPPGERARMHMAARLALGLVAAGGLGVGGLAGLTAAVAPAAVLTWAVLCVAVLGALAWLHRTLVDEDPDDAALNQWAELHGAGLHVLAWAWAAAVPLVLPALGPPDAGVFSLGLMLAAGAMALTSAPRLAHVLALLLPVSLLMALHHAWARPDPVLLATLLGIAALAGLLARALAARLAPRLSH